jgi:Tfp pilus assembly protein PilN
MIKINLLSEGKRPAAVRKARAGGAGVQDVGIWLLVAGAIAGLLAGGGYWWYLDGKLKDKKEEVAQAQRQVDALQAVIREVEDYKKKKKSLTDKIAVINELKSNQRGPVRVMDYISRALPELLWLDRLKMTAANIEVEGRAFNPNAVANFMDNLDKVPEFKEPVLKETTAQANGVYHFFVTFDYSFAPAKKPEAPLAGAAGAPGSPGAPGDQRPGSPGGAPGSPPGAPGTTAPAPVAGSGAQTPTPATSPR